MRSRHLIINLTDEEKAYLNYLGVETTSFSDLSFDAKEVTIMYMPLHHKILWNKLGKELLQLDCKPSKFILNGPN
ncbi:hypothetical protein L596_006634 [Steinernema carpocapsae]|uniref:Uncharacterized protein n=1 Tax=Steinernema carpocapsae TaxID=34508 RepID=A0A4U8V580_STECR|nr:hypothetical protein L596_006634 [Steinernema carpocapsae]